LGASLTSDFEGFPGYPWPKLNDPIAERYASMPPALQLPGCVARMGPIGFGNRIDDECWAGYAKPLLEHALGYSQTAFKLALPNGRAELVPEAGPLLDVRKYRVRIWNLGTGADAVPWILEKVQVVAINPTPLPGGAPPIEVSGAGGTSLPPGAPWVSDAFSISIPQQSVLSGGSHTVVLIKGTIGSASNTPIEFGLPIPNPMVFVEQDTTTTLLESVNNVRSDCCTDPKSCSTCGEDATIVQPIKQEVKGKILLRPGQRDLLGKQVDAVVKAAQEQDSRIAGIVLLSWNKLNQNYYEPTIPSKSALELTGGGLVKSNGYLWLRSPTAGDVADPVSIDFKATVDASDFYLTSVPVGVPDPLLTLSGVRIVVWTTAGAVCVSRIICADCINAIEMAGGIITSPTTAVFPTSSSQ